jgi:hypothetical protein
LGATPSIGGEEQELLFLGILMFPGKDLGNIHLIKDRWQVADSAEL